MLTCTCYQLQRLLLLTESKQFSLRVLISLRFKALFKDVLIVISKKKNRKDKMAWYPTQSQILTHFHRI